MNNEINNEQILREFLVYSYFGIVPERIYDKNSFEKLSADDYNTYCTKRAIMVAYRDATNQGAYNALFKEELADEKLDEKSEAARKEAAEFLLDEIHGLNGVSDFEQWHAGVCSEIEKRYGEVKHNGKSFFTYGNASVYKICSFSFIMVMPFSEAPPISIAIRITLLSYIIIFYSLPVYNNLFVR